MTEAARSVEGRASWRTAWITLGILSISFGSPLLIVVGMKPMQEALGTERSVLALAGALVWVGTGAGGILMGWLADRIGLRTTVAIGACMIAGGLALSSTGSIWALYVGHGLMVGLAGQWRRLSAAAGLCQPLVRPPPRHRDRADLLGPVRRRRRSGPRCSSSGISSVGWQAVMLAYGGVVLVVILPAILFLQAAAHGAAAVAAAASRGRGPGQRHRVAGLHPNVAQALICVAGFCCCIPMSVPVGASRRLLQRHRHQPDAQRRHAVGDAGRGLPRAPGLGRAGRPDRRPAHGAGRLGLPGRRHRALPADPGRGRPVRRLRRLRPGLRRHHPVLLAWRSAISSRRRKRRGACRSPCSRR